MEKSIENVWKQGFIQDDALVAPRINDLYNQKSLHWVDRFKRNFRLNLWMIAGGAIVLFIASLVLGIPVVGACFGALLLFVAAFGFRKLRRLESVDVGQSSYDFLRNFNAWLRSTLQSFGQLYRFLYPLFFLVFMVGFWRLPAAAPLTEKILLDSETLIWAGIPVWYAAGTLAIALLIMWLSPRIYDWDMRLVYGKEFRKLEEMIGEMEELAGA